jgi:hypothetical protein
MTAYELDGRGSNPGRSKLRLPAQERFLASVSRPDDSEVPPSSGPVGIKLLTINVIPESR